MFMKKIANLQYLNRKVGQISAVADFVYIFECLYKTVNQYLEIAYYKKIKYKASQKIIQGDYDLNRHTITKIKLKVN